MINTEALQLQAAFVFFSSDIGPSLTAHLIPRPVCLISSHNRPQVSANKCRVAGFSCLLTTIIRGEKTNQTHHLTVSSNVC